MADQDEKGKPERKQPARAGAKKKWESPRVKSGSLFESNSLSCGKNGTPPSDENCLANYTSS